MTFKIILRFIVMLIISIQFYFFAYASKGIILTYDGKLNLYENDKFIKQINQFSNSNMILFTGDYYYISKIDRKTYKYYLEKWSVDKNTVTIIKPNSTYSPIADMSFQSKGSGFILTQDGSVDYYLNNTFMKNIKSQPLEEFESWGPISFSGNALYKTIISAENYRHYYSSVLKCSKAADHCYVIAGFSRENADLISFDQNGDGFLVTHSNDTQGPILYQFKNDRIVKVIFYPFAFEDYKRVLSVTPDSVYFISPDSNKIITKCDLYGNNCIDLNIPDYSFRFASFK